MNRHMCLSPRPHLVSKLLDENVLTARGRNKKKADERPRNSLHRYGPHSTGGRGGQAPLVPRNSILTFWLQDLAHPPSQNHRTVRSTYPPSSNATPLSQCPFSRTELYCTTIFHVQCFSHSSEGGLPPSSASCMQHCPGHSKPLLHVERGRNPPSSLENQQRLERPRPLYFPPSKGCVRPRFPPRKISSDRKWFHAKKDGKIAAFTAHHS